LLQQEYNIDTLQRPVATKLPAPFQIHLSCRPLRWVIGVFESRILQFSTIELEGKELNSVLRPSFYNRTELYQNANALTELLVGNAVKSDAAGFCWRKR
jgi:hypothetical protein